jgi:hypothetical protein
MVTVTLVRVCYVLEKIPQRGIDMWRLAVCLLLLPQWTLADEVHFSYGLQSFLWEEFDTNGNSLLDETGFRHVLELSTEIPIGPDWHSDISGHFTFGTVTYDGQDSNGDPVSTDTDYSGYGLEAGINYFPVENSSQRKGEMGARFAAGMDIWERSLLGAGGYNEDYVAIYGRIAGVYHIPSAWRVELGAKVPFATYETVNLSDYGFVEEVELKPKGQPSLYARFVYPFNERFSLKCIYDGYRFNKSNADTVYNLNGRYYAVHQPESDMHTFTVAISLSI